MAAAAVWRFSGGGSAKTGLGLLRPFFSLSVNSLFIASRQAEEKLSNSITVVIPAFNEERSLAQTVGVVRAAAKRAGMEYEVVIVDDCSTDRTPEIVRKLEQEQPGVRSVRHSVNLGLGAAYKTGVAAAGKAYVILVPGDDAWPEDALVRILEKVGQADIVIPYIEVAGDKTAFRRALSRTYTAGINFLFRLHVPYYNGIVVHRTDLVRSIEIRADDFSYQTEALVKLLRRGHSFVGVAANTNARPGGQSKALGMRNVIRVVSSVLRLFFSVHFSKRA